MTIDFHIYPTFIFLVVYLIQAWMTVSVNQKSVLITQHAVLLFPFFKTKTYIFTFFRSVRREGDRVEYYQTIHLMKWDLLVKKLNSAKFVIMEKHEFNNILQRLVNNETSVFGQCKFGKKNWKMNTISFWYS